MKTDFPIGKTVWLASGSRPLTVTDTAPFGDISVVWLDELGRPQRMTLPTECFVLDITECNKK